MQAHLLIYNAVMTLTLVVGLIWLARRPTGRNAAGLLAFGAAIAVWMGLALGRAFFPAAQLAAYGIFLYAPILLLGVAWVLRRAYRRRAIVAAVLALAIAAVGVDAVLIEPHWLEVTRHEIRSPKITEPVRVVLLADLQTDHIGSYERRVLEQIRAEKPDLLLLAGDYIQVGDKKRREELSAEMNQLFRELLPETRLGTFAVEGNVDPMDCGSIFDGTDVQVAGFVDNFVLDGLALTCLGLEQSMTGLTAVRRPADAADQFHIVMGHAPDFALGDIDADLLVAGHTHGGQVRLPLIGPIMTLSSVPRSWAAGLTQLDDGRRLIVSRGVGMERGRAPRLRFLCRPELVVIDLLPQE